MKILGLCSFPVESAATRYRLVLYRDFLNSRGVELDIVPFLDSQAFKSLYGRSNIFAKAVSVIVPFLRRLALTAKARDYDAIIVQREAMFFGPEIFEWLYRKVGGCPLILDLDDATYIRYDSPTFGRLGSALKFFGKTDRLIRSAEVVVCGNRFIAEHVEKSGGHAEILPTIVDPEVFKPAPERRNVRPVLGWIGTHSTYPLLESIFPVLTELSRERDFVLRVVGAGRERIEVEGVTVENVEWNLEREPNDFAGIDIGLYPLATSSSASSEWLMGKSGFKAIQYLACGVPFVMTPIGVCAELAQPGSTHFLAAGPEEWKAAIKGLLDDGALRKRMGAAGREYFENNFRLEAQADRLLRIIEEAVAGK